MQVGLDEISPDLGNLEINDPAWSWAETQHSTTNDTLTSNGAAVPSRVPSPAPERTAPPDDEDVEEYLRQILPAYVVQFIMRKDRAATN